MRARSPKRSSSFDLDNWKATNQIAQQIEAINGDRHRRGSFKKDRNIEGDLDGMGARVSPPMARRKVSFSGQLPTQHTQPDASSPAGQHKG